MKRLISGILAGAMLSIPSTSIAKDIQHFIINGQSLSTGHQSYPVLSTENIPGNYMVGGEVWTNAGLNYHHNYWSGASWDLNPLIGTVSYACQGDQTKTRNAGCLAECPVVGAVNHMQLGWLNGQDLIASSVGASGATIEELSKECTLNQRKNNYGSFEELIANTPAAIKAKGFDNVVCPAIFWMQGEFNYDIKIDATTGACGLHPGENNCTDRKTYKQLLVTLKNNMQNDIKAAYGQTSTPVFITYQTGAQYVRRTIEIGMAQLQAANENDDMVMAGSPYPCTDRGGHLDANGYRWFGEMLAKAYYKHSHGEPTLAMQPKKISREDGGKTLRIKYYVPCGPMVFDTNTLPKIQNYGFAVYQGGYSSGAIKNPASITIEGDDVVMKFAEPLTGKIYVTYGGPDVYVETRVSGLNDLKGHGNLRDSDPYKSQLTYIDLDSKNEDGSYVWPRQSSKDNGGADGMSLRPDYEPKDADGNVIYGKPYPLYNFSVGFYYVLEKKIDELEILDENNNPVPVEERESGELEVAYVSADGSDANDGSATAPFSSLTKAVASVKWDGAKIVVIGKVEVDDELNLEGYTSLTFEGGDDTACLDGMGATRLAETEKTNITFRNITVTNFVANGAGGVLSMLGGDFVADNVSFINNGTSRMQDDNGGVLSFKNAGTATITNCLFSGNIAFLGGAIYTYLSKGIVLNRTIFEGNMSKKNPACTNNNSRGGAMSVWGTNVDAENCVFTGNESSNQCGAFQLGWTNITDQHFTLKNCDILDNKAPGDHGGAMVAENCGQRNFEYNFINCNFSGNRASGCGSVLWVQNDNNVSPTQTMNFYNCTIVGNHNTSGTFHSCILLWETGLKVNVVNTILEGNTSGNGKNYSDLHAGQFTADKQGNINIVRSVVGKFVTERRDNLTADQIADKPVVDEFSQFNISPVNASQGEANYAGLLPADENGIRIFAGLDSKGVGMGDDQLLVEKYDLATDRLGNVRSRNCIGSVEMIDGLSGIQMVTAEDNRLSVALDGDMLRVISALYGDNVTMNIYSVDGRCLTSCAMTDSEVTVDASVIGSGIKVLRVSSSSAARSVIFKL